MLLPTKLCKKYCNFWTGIAKLPIEIGRGMNTCIPREGSSQKQWVPGDFPVE